MDTGLRAKSAAPAIDIGRDTTTVGLRSWRAYDASVGLLPTAPVYRSVKEEGL